MSKRHPLDDFFKDRLAEASAPVPDQMWQRIANARAQAAKRRKRRFLLWSSTGTLASVGVLALLLWSDNDPALGAFPVQFGGTETVVTNQDATSNDTQVYEAAVQIDYSVGQRASDTQNNTSLTQNTSVSAQQASRSTRKFQTPANDAIAMRLRDNATSPVTNSTDNLATTINTPVIAEELPVVETEPVPIVGPHQRSRSKVVDRLPGMDFDLTESLNEKLFGSAAPRCARFDGPLFRLDVEALAGPAYAEQVLRAKTPESVAHLEIRQRSESPLLSYTGGFRLAASSKSGISLRTGLMYTQINDEFADYIGEKTLYETISDANGNIIRIDTVVIQNYTEYYNNRLTFIELPMLLGYETQVGKLRVGINAGAFLNLAFAAKGNFYSPADGQVAAFGQSGDSNVLPIFNRNTTAAWYAGMNFAYNLKSRYSIMAEPYFKAYPRPLSTDVYDLSQNYWTVGLQLGMRMRL